MPRSVKILVWVLVFLAFAGAGAWVASRTDPFPPGVTDPGARPPVSPSSLPGPSAPAQPSRWQLTAEVRSVHVLHVGGACRSDWEVQALLRERPDGALAGEGLIGEGLATLAGDAGCDFATADAQTDAVVLRVRGSLRDDLIVLRVRAGRSDPAGSKDLGGLLATLPSVLDLGARPFKGSTVVQMPDGNEGTYRATWHSRLACVDEC